MLYTEERPKAKKASSLVAGSSHHRTPFRPERGPVVAAPAGCSFGHLCKSKRIRVQTSSDLCDLHIVYMGGRPQEHAFAANNHYTMLHKSLGSASSAKESLVYSYWRSFNGFAARLTEAEAAGISEMEGVISVKPSRKYKLHTTRSWDFMNLTVNELGPSTNSDVIIGFLDSGVWPEHPSFNDKGFGPPPAKWNGTCTTQNFTCNNKIIGARYYNSDDLYLDGDIPSPRDTDGHGTHTASTASGVQVEGASYFGLGNGTARGMPNSRIAVYKVCWMIGCDSANMLKAFDDAIADGVDIISISFGGGWPLHYFDDLIAIGSFHAMTHGILTLGSAGNSGTDPASVTNFAPWMLTVAASSIDRKFTSRMELGNGEVYTGIAINTFDLNETSYPLMWGGDAANYTGGYNRDIAKSCIHGAMNANRVSGKIVYCESLGDGSGILNANGAGLIMADVLSFDQDVAFSWPLPTTFISPQEGNRVLEYIRTTDNPVATIFYSDEWKDVMAPVVASFSSRGPNPLSPDILKPDLTAPGVNILAGWSPSVSSSIYDGDKRSTLFNILSGTSMSCPHVSGAAAYVKSVHPDWSPAAIKSALMTTASVMDPKKHEDLEFAYGSGHIDPVAALDPGLVFNASEVDYIDFLCEHGYNTTTLRRITGDKSTCAGTRARDLNYPSFSLYVQDGQTIKKTFTRKVTNVCKSNSTYTASWHVPASSIIVTVKPSILTFSDYGETNTFTVSVSGPAISQKPIVSGAVMWTDGTHVVRVPLVVYNYIQGTPNNLGVAQSMKVPARQKSSIYQKVEEKGKQLKSHG
ncbi:Subtilase family protein [Striga hermonthica]|uniref:Subtilase family protein n=1 Tax=Striga hermonthica TaxID=68872 RepID=A0A9N7NT97_STRHE|nr:Subtilase family protein [Striga hermonthica]